MFKKSKFFICLIIFSLLLTTCWNETDPNGPSGPSTKIVFDNSDGTCTILVYSNPQRTETSKIAEVPAGSFSGEIEWAPGSSVPFFLSFNISVIGIDGLVLPYTPELGQDQIYRRVDEAIVNTLDVPSLAETIPASAQGELLSNNSYIFIQNITRSQIRLLRGTAVLPPDNLSSHDVDPGERALYSLSGGASRTPADYELLGTGIFVKFPTGIAKFENGRVYNFIFDGTELHEFYSVDIRLANIANTSPSAGQMETFLRFNNANQFSVSIFRDYSRNVKLTDVAGVSLFDPIVTTPNYGGALFYPTYNMLFDGVSVPYEGEVILSRIDPGMTVDNPNNVIIPLLTGSGFSSEERNKPLTATVYLKLENATSSSLTLRRGIIDQRPIGAASHLLNPGETGVYSFSPGDVSGFTLRRNVTDAQLSTLINLTVFASGNLYSLRDTGTSVTENPVRPLTIQQALDNPPRQLGGTVSITGPAVVGGILSVNTDNLNNVVGSINYQWRRGGVNIGTNSSTYTVHANDADYTISVVVTTSGSYGSITSPPTAAVPILSENFEGTNHLFTLVNVAASSRSNRWYVGTAIAESGTRAAYISNDGGVTNTYSLTTSAGVSSNIVHMYRDVTFPASTTPFVFTFDWSCQGETTNREHDFLRVFLLDRSVSLSAGTLPTSGSLGTFNMGGQGWNKANISIPASNAGTTKRLVFTWVNDSSGGNQPPAAVDNILITR